MSGFSSEDFKKKLESLNNRFKLLEQSLEKNNRTWEVSNARQVTGSQQKIKNIQVNISKFQIVDVYNIAPQILASIAIKVSLTADSYRQNNFSEVYFEKTGNGNYWIVNTTENIHFLVPKDTIKINIPVMNTVKLLFNCLGYQQSQSKDFCLNKAALVSLCANSQQWKLQEIGEIDFNNTSPISQVQLELKQAKEDRQQIKHKLNELHHNFEQFKYQLQELTLTQANQNRYQPSENGSEEVEREIQAVDEKPKKRSVKIQSSNLNSIDIPFSWQNPRELFSLVGHTDTIRCLAVVNWQGDNEKQIIISGSFDKTIRIWNLKQGTLFKTFNISSKVSAITANFDGSSFISGGDDGNLQIWDILSVQQRTINAHSNRILAIKWSPNSGTIISGSRDHSIKSWNYNTGNLEDNQNYFVGDYGSIIDLDISFDGQILASSTGDNIIRLWELEERKLLQTNFKHLDLVWSVAISPNGNTLVCGCRDRTIKLWDIPTGKLKFDLTEHSAEVWSVAISPDGNTLASGSGDRTIKLWNFNTGELLCSLENHLDAVYSVVFSPDGKYLVSTGKDKTIKIWQSQHLDLLGTKRA